MGKIRAVLDKALETTIIILTIILVIVTSAQVFWRYVLNDPIPWSEELARYTFVWLVFLAAALAFRDGKHMSADLIQPLLSPALKRIQGALIRVIIGAFLVVIVAVAPEILGITLDQASASLSIPIAFVYAAFPVSAVIMLIYLVLDIAACRGGEGQ